MSTTLRHSGTLFGQTRGAILALLYGHADEAFYFRQLVRHVGGGHGAVQREVKELADAGIITRKTLGNQVYYQANLDSPLFSELKSLVAKTVGVHDVLRSALLRLLPRIKSAFVFGSVARFGERSDSDLDLMVIGDVSFAEVVECLSSTQKTLGREVNPSVYSLSDFLSKKASGNHFLMSVLAREKLFVIGGEHELERLGKV
jgi:uncharacterized protein